MRRSIFTVILSVTISILGFGQRSICDCHIDYFTGEKAYFANQKDSTGFYFRRAFSNPDFGSISNYYNAADKLIRIGDIDLASEVLMMSTIKGASYSDLKKNSSRYPDISLNIDSSALVYYETDSSSIDSLLIRELQFLEERDQWIRTEYEDRYSDQYLKLVDYSNFLMLKNIIDRYDGQLPDLNVIGWDGEEYISTILIHSDVEWLAEIFPALIDGIRKGYMYNEELLYQIERNIVSSGEVYVYDERSKSIRLGGATSPIGNSIQYHQFYGGFDIFLTKKKSSIWWPFEKNADQKEVNKLRKALCLDKLEDYFLRKPYIKTISDSEFLEIISRY